MGIPKWDPVSYVPIKGPDVVEISSVASSIFS
jgi:hypothetical protein